MPNTPTKTITVITSMTMTAWIMRRMNHVVMVGPTSRGEVTNY